MNKAKSTEKNNIAASETPKKKSKGKKPREVMNKHIQDKNDVISDEDFKNLDLNLENETQQDRLLIRDDKNRLKDEDKDPEELTSRDLLK